MINATKEEVFQMMAIEIAANAHRAELNQITAGSPNRDSTSLTMPYSEWKNHAKISPTNGSGIAQGISSDIRTGHLTTNGRLAISARASPRMSAPGTVIRVMSTVFHAVSWNT